MDLRELQNNWNEFGIKDPRWTILTHPSRHYGQGDLDSLPSLSSTDAGMKWSAFGYFATKL